MISTCYVGFVLVSGILFNPCHITSVEEGKNIAGIEKCEIRFISHERKEYHDVDCKELKRKLMESRNTNKLQE